MPPRPPLPLLAPASRAELREWLAQNHANSPGVRMAIGKKGNTVTALTYDDAVEEGVAFGWIDSTAGKVDEQSYFVTFTPRKSGSAWATSNKERVARLAAAGLMAPAGVAAVEAARADGSWGLLNDVDHLIMPPDLAEALGVAGRTAAWDALSASQRRRALYWIASAKHPETRAKRIAETARAAGEGHGPQ